MKTARYYPILLGVLVITSNCDRTTAMPADTAACIADSPNTCQYVITSVSIDASSLNRFADETDIWPITWADDGTLYAAGGDGRGWDAVDTRGMDIDRLSGAPTGNLARAGTELISKIGVLPKGIISVDGALYIAEQDRNTFGKLRIGKSTDHGATWRYNGDGATNWDYESPHFVFTALTFVQFGQDYANARDAYVYGINTESDDGSGSPYDGLVMLRTPKIAIQDVSQHEYFAGLDANNNPIWSKDISARRYFFRRQGEIHWGPSITYNPKLGRYLLAFFTDDRATLALYDGPEPWGPWAKVHEATLLDTTEKFMVNFVNSQAWLSADGLTWWFVTSGLNEWDSFNVLKATLTVRKVSQ